ncbi:HDOD domain-containing protein [Holophaga foetida]|uniref:HDOD domain-containing protein n=1 Tax=Holophaga foetida TaxID=35839 RepID=UPI0002474286|nr:HDOD domain-containing protein [Holophaga foetida]
MITADLVGQRVQSLPSLPTTIVSLGQAVSDDRCTVDRILGILAKDPPLSASMLRLANSALYQGDRPASDLQTAVLRLGFDAVLNLGRTAAIIRTFRTATTFDPILLWQHSVAVAITAKGICRLQRKNQMAETAFLVGLLHDIGKIALDRCFTEEYGPVVAAVREGEEGVAAERRILGIDHGRVGALVALRWNFTETQVEVIRDHHEPVEGEFLSSLIHLSDLLVRSRMPNGPYDEELRFSLEALPAFQTVFGPLTDDLDLERLTFGVDDELDHAITFVKLAFQE